jgi:hypothetical protein
LVLAVLDRMVTDRGGIVAYRNTDSSLIPAGPEAEVLMLADGTTARSLSWSEVDEILAAFPPLSPSSWWPVWSVERGTVDQPLRAVVSGPNQGAWSVRHRRTRPGEVPPGVHHRRGLRRFPEQGKSPARSTGRPLATHSLDLP